MDGLPPNIHIDEALSSTQMDELPLYTLTSPSLQLRRTGSHLQLILTSSSLNPDRRAPAIHNDEPFAATHIDGLPPTTFIDEALPSPQRDELLLFTRTSPSLQLRWTSSHYSHRRSLRYNPDGWAPNYNSY